MTDLKKEIRKTANSIAIGLILYTFILYGTVFLQLIISTVIIFVRYPQGDILQKQAFQDLFDNLLTSGTSSIIAVILGCCGLFIFFRKRVPAKELFQSGKKMSVGIFFQMLSIFMLCQLFFTFVGIVLELGLNLTGYSAISSLEAATSTSVTVSMFLYATFYGPLAEEIVYRGFVLRSLQKYGNMVALVISAALFGIMHANIPQGIFAFGVGLILGYITLEYSIGWSIALHMVNNCVFGDLFGMAISSFSEEIQIILSYGLQIGLSIPAIIILYKNRKKIWLFHEKSKSEKKIYSYILLSVGMIIFITINLLLAIMALEKI